MVSDVPRPDCHAPKWTGAIPPHIELDNSRVIFEAGNVGTRATARVTPLHMAIQSGSGKIVRSLLKHGADCNARDSQDMTPLIYTIIKDQESIAEMLLLHGARTTALDRQNRSALH
jgi:ankyrin repeat protein